MHIKKKMVNKLLFIAFLIVFLSLYLAEAASSIGVSPANANFNNILRGGYSERYVTISTDSAEEENVSIEPIGEIKDWVNLSEYNFSISKDNPKRILVSISPGEFTQNGNFSGALRIRLVSSASGLTEGHAASAVKAILDFSINAEVVDFEIKECSAQDFEVMPVEKGEDLVFKANVGNLGNVRIRPKLEMKLWDQDQINVLKSEEGIGDFVMPTREGSVELRVKTDNLDIGQYWAEISAPDCLASDVLSVDVLAPGSLRADGSLVGIFGKKNAIAGENVPIEAIFKNTGQKEVVAQFRGNVVSNGEVVLVIESEKSRVPINQYANFTFFFTPKNEGKYVISGRAYYESKKTFESSLSIDVAKKEKDNSYILYGAIIFLIAALTFLLYNVGKERRRYSEILSRKSKYR